MNARLDVLIVEDDPTLRDVLLFHFEAEGWDVRAEGDGGRAVDAVAERRPDVVVLDVMLPTLSGIDVCAALRARFDPSPGVVMVTARDAEIDVVLGLEVGADDYVVKPCRPRELVARVKAVARRLSDGGAPSAGRSAGGSAPLPPALARIERGDLSLDEGARAVAVRGRPVKLTPTEFALLAFFARAPGRVFGRMELLAEVFGSTHEGYARNVDCHVTRLRRKLEAAGMSPAPVRTSHGAGYYFAARDDDHRGGA